MIEIIGIMIRESESLLSLWERVARCQSSRKGSKT
jgi:hypothetical protein